VYNGTVHQLLIDFKKAYDSVGREVLCSVLIGFEIPRKLVGLISMYLNETYSTVRTGKFQSDKFPVQNGLKQEDTLSSMLFEFALEHVSSRIQDKRDSLGSWARGQQPHTVSVQKPNMPRNDGLQQQWRPWQKNMDLRIGT
jgi:hypothetical protein